MKPARDLGKRGVRDPWDESAFNAIIQADADYARDARTATAGLVKEHF